MHGLTFPLAILVESPMASGKSTSGSSIEFEFRGAACRASFFEDHTFNLLTVFSVNDTFRTIIFRSLRRTLHVLQFQSY
jgi:hypothetical protein